MTDTKHTAAQPLDLDKLEALAKAATPGPWANGYGTGVTGGRAAASCSWDCTDVRSVPVRKGKDIIAWIAAFDPSDEEKSAMETDAEYIAAANPATILALIAQARTARLDTTAIYVDESAINELRNDHFGSVCTDIYKNPALGRVALSAGAADTTASASIDTPTIRTIVTKAREFYLGYLSRHIPGDDIDAVRADVTTDTATRAIAFDLRATLAPVAAQPELTVWYGPMPESNGKSNFTAVLMRKDSMWNGPHVTIERSEYPDRIRYEADRVRYLIGELAEEPFILDYDADKHSGYVDPVAAQQAAAPVEPILANGIPVEQTKFDWVARVISENSMFNGEDIHRAWNELVAFYVAHKQAAAKAPSLAELQRYQFDGNEHDEGALEPWSDGDWVKFADVERIFVAPSAGAATTQREAPKLAYGHRDDFYLMANARRLGLTPINEVKAMPNWVLAKHLFATGSTSAHQICADAGIDPDGYNIERATQQEGK